MECERGILQIRAGKIHVEQAVLHLDESFERVNGRFVALQETFADGLVADLRLPERRLVDAQRVVGGSPSPIGFGSFEQEVVEGSGAFGVALLESDAGLADGGAALVYKKPLAERPTEPKIGLAVGGQGGLGVEKGASGVVVRALDFEAEQGRPFKACFGVLEVVFVVEIFCRKIGVRLWVETAFGA